MHELSIAQNIINVVAQELQRRGGGRVLRVRLRVGAWSGVEPESLGFCYEASVPGTLLAGSKLEIEHVPLRCRCPACGSEFEPERFSRACTACGEARTELLGGTELEIADFEVE
jgi:hydrogenase nickel incorporation protein HypA/HybF